MGADLSDNQTLLNLTAQIVSACYAHSKPSYGFNPQGDRSVHEAPDISAFIMKVYDTLKDLGSASVAEPKVDQKPAVPIKKSVHLDFIICLEDGRQFKTLKRHLRSAYGMTPDQYREKWGLPADYSMVAPNYAAKRSEMAKAIGLGKKA
jgi:predicted transcriptional regulator